MILTTPTRRSVADQYAAMTNVTYAESDDGHPARRPGHWNQERRHATRILMKPVCQMIRSLPISGPFIIRDRTAAKERADIDALKAWAKTRAATMWLSPFSTAVSIITTST